MKKLKVLELKVRVNKSNNQYNCNIPKKELSTEQLDNIQKKGVIKALFE